MNLPKQVRQAINKSAHKVGLRYEIMVKDKLTELAVMSLENGCSYAESMQAIRKEAERLALPNG